MKIRQIRFKNLNSLLGEWTIDLSHKSFVADGIFTITGPTGSGKTTILDAICLALYGSTPRLGKITKSSNEIMSRHTGECFAEILLETKTGRFFCHFSQHRARKTASGELQAPKHEISDADSKEVLESSLRGSAEWVEKATGMNFERFTRSMLLAQGDFAAFLRASPDDRAPILEQITGTEIYSKISIQVHELRSMEQKKLDLLLSAVDGMQLLSPDEEKILTENLALKHQAEADLTLQLNQKNRAIIWLEGIKRLEEELSNLGLAKKDLDQKIADFSFDRERLQLATKALEISSNYTLLITLQKTQITDQKSLETDQIALPSLIANHQNTNAELQVKMAELNLAKEEQKKAIPLLNKVREFDLKIDQMTEPLKKNGDLLTELNLTLNTLKKSEQEHLKEIDKQKQKLSQLTSLLNSSLSDEKLVSSLTGLEARFAHLKNLSLNLVSQQKEKDSVSLSHQKALKTWQEHIDSLAQEKPLLEAHQKELLDQKDALLTLLEHKAVGDWRKSKDAILTKKELLLKALETFRVVAEADQFLINADSKLSYLSKEETEIKNSLDSKRNFQTSLEKELLLLETQLVLLKHIFDLKEHRLSLQDGEPCPLCGALDHPFAKGNIPLPDQTKIDLDRVRGALKTLFSEIADLSVTLAKIQKDQEQTLIQKKESTQIMNQAQKQILEYCQNLAIFDQNFLMDDSLRQRFQNLLSETDLQLLHAADVLHKSDLIEKNLVLISESLEKEKDSLIQKEQKTQTALHQKEISAQEEARLNREITSCQSLIHESMNTLNSELRIYNLELLTLEGLDSVYTSLVSRRDQWVLWQRQKIELETSLNDLNLLLKFKAEQILKTEQEIKKQDDSLQQLLVEQKNLFAERQSLLGEKTVIQEEKRFFDLIKTCETNFDSARQKEHLALHNLNQSKARIDTIQKAMQNRQIELQSAHDEFQIRLNSSGFNDISQYEKASLPEQVRDSLARQAQALTDYKNTLLAREAEKTQALALERKKELSHDSMEELQDSRLLLNESCRELQQEMGGIRQKLKDNQNLKVEKKERFLALDRQREECIRWNLLHELIGSADGKKYRNFAQGLTFEIMINHANRQLLKMSDRYLLVRDREKPLELNVIDSYQTGEIRSTKNLSGGESFIVSLSLALGLSSMASKNVRVDSLFLDEGFGTLDEEALETALETLAGLRQDNKLIGIISHIPALKERISTQIRITPLRGGKSHLNGPGCQGGV